MVKRTNDTSQGSFNERNSKSPSVQSTPVPELSSDPSSQLSSSGPDCSQDRDEESQGPSSDDSLSLEDRKSCHLGSAETAHDNYNPQRWTCSGYGDTDAEQSRRKGVNDILIDYDDDSVERLSDIRPYLYSVGYWGEYEAIKKAPENHRHRISREQPSDVIEQRYVELGRSYLKSAHAERRGCFVGAREFNRLVFDEMMPLFRYVHSGASEDDVGLYSGIHPSGFIGGILMTNIRVPLPDRDVVAVQPGQPGWDRFIQWLYSVQSHPIPAVCEYSWLAWEYQRVLAIEGFQLGHLKREALYRYPDLDSMIPYSMDLKQAQSYIAEKEARERMHNEEEETEEEEEEEEEEEGEE